MIRNDKYPFQIQAGNPQITGRFDPDDKTVRAAMETVFEFPTENAIVFWQNCFFPICYKYELSWMIEDLLELLYALLNSANGSQRVFWSPDTLHGEWKVSWESDRIRIETDWEELRGPCLEKLNSDYNVLSLPKHDFLCEWKMVLETVSSALIGSGYGTKQLRDFKQLNSICTRIPSSGVIYSKSKDFQS